ncbi:ras and EF-hand domain-containing protein-like isoform X2 [Astyanax mexicanus]|uniref:RAS and EF-hand domain containing n=1 Tax=Astyanax mexicanus TaxID=7994 RepID=A0A8B9K1S2_ASTMX|nr:ras and EF-hand domain-containing protein-like isoform X2 [Astyanax mexicanus]
MDTADLRRLFSACDGNKSGRIEYEDFIRVCRELSVPAGDVRTLFSKFDVDGDGCINYSDFCSSFNEVSETLNLASLGSSGQCQASAWAEFENTLDGDVAYYLGRLGDPLGELYQEIHATSDMLLLQQYEDLIKALVLESREHRMESEQLETSLRRSEETASSQIVELEEDLQRQLTRTEQRVREEEQKKMEGTLAMLQIKHENELADLQAAVERLTEYQEETELNSPREDLIKLRKKIREVTQENDELRSSLLKAQMNISVLQVELDKLKNAYTDEKLQHERESNELKKMVVEYQSYAGHIEFLQEMNKKLYDSNDGLRSALTKDSSSKRRLSPKNEKPPRKLKPLRQSTINQSSFANEEDEMSVDGSKDKFSLVARWADKYLDSGVSLQTDTDRMSASNYDSDESHNSVETVHHSDSYVHSEMEMSDFKSEMNVSVSPSRVSSLASSLRRRLSAFPVKQTEADLFDSDGSLPMYRLVLAGDAGSGKSSFLLRLSLNEFRGDMQTTLGVDFQMKKMLVDGEKTNLQIWDTAGQERFRSIARSYFRKAHGVLLLYDVTSESSFLNVREWMEQIQESTDGNVPMCVIGNKVDMRAERPEGSCVSPAQGEKLAMTYNALFCETSAKEGTNIVEAVLHLAREVKKNSKQRRHSESQVKLSLNSGKKALSNCCGV